MSDIIIVPTHTTRKYDEKTRITTKKTNADVIIRVEGDLDYCYGIQTTVTNDKDKSKIIYSQTNSESSAYRSTGKITFDATGQWLKSEFQNPGYSATPELKGRVQCAFERKKN